MTLVAGEYDVVAAVELGDREALARIVVEGGHGVSGVVDTTTDVAFEP